MKQVFQTTFEPSFVTPLSFLHRRVIWVNVDFQGVSDLIFSIKTRCCPQVIDLLRIELRVTNYKASRYPQLAQVSGPLTFVNQTTIFKWSMAHLVAKNGHLKNFACYQKHWPTWSRYTHQSQFDCEHNREGICYYSKWKGHWNLTSYKCCISTLILKRKMITLRNWWLCEIILVPIHPLKLCKG